MRSQVSERSEVPAGIEELASQVISAAVDVHRKLGPGFLESVYKRAMEVELRHQEIPFQTEAIVRVNYRHIEVGRGRVDLLIDDKLVVELKATQHITNVHRAQALHYLKATGLPLALILNFHRSLLLRGTHRVVLTAKQDEHKSNQKRHEPR